MVQTRRAGVLVTAITLALAVAGCNGAAMKVLPLKVAPGIGAVDHSWSWGVVPGTADAEPLVVGIDRRGGGPATLQIGTVALDRLFRAPTLPSLPGSPLAVQAMRKGAGAVIVGGLLDDLGQPKVFVLTSDDGKAWRPLATNPEVDVIPDAATVLDGAVLLTGGARSTVSPRMAPPRPSPCLLWRTSSPSSA